jgi:protein TonB
VSGTVIITSLICEHGNLVDARITQSIPLLDHAATDAVLQWSFRPATRMGYPVPCWLEIPLKFTLH